MAVQPELSLSEAFSMLVPGDLDKINEVASVQLFCHSEVTVELDILAIVNQCIVIALRWLQHPLSDMQKTNLCLLWMEFLLL